MFKCPSCGSRIDVFQENMHAYEACTNPMCYQSPVFGRKPKPEPVQPRGPQPGERWAETSKFKAMEHALKVLLLDKKTRAYLDQNDPMAVRQAERALSADTHKEEAKYSEHNDNPGNACWSDYRMVGKTISSIHASDYFIGKDAKGETIKKPFIDLRFTDGTYVRIETCEDGLAEDFGDGRGPVTLMKIPFMGVTEYSEYLCKDCGWSIDGHKDDCASKRRIS